jgi:hypothetical protein
VPIPGHSLATAPRRYKGPATTLTNESRRVRLYRTILQSATASLDARIREPYGARGEEADSSTTYPRNPGEVWTNSLGLRQYTAGNILRPPLMTNHRDLARAIRADVRKTSCAAYAGASGDG